MPFDMFIAAALINRLNAVPILAIMASAYHFDSWSLGEHIGYIAWYAVYGFMGWATRHVLREEIIGTIHDRRVKPPPRRRTRPPDRTQLETLTPAPELNLRSVEAPYPTIGCSPMNVSQKQICCRVRDVR